MEDGGMEEEEEEGQEGWRMEGLWHYFCLSIMFGCGLNPCLYVEALGYYSGILTLLYGISLHVLLSLLSALVLHGFFLCPLPCPP